MPHLNDKQINDKISAARIKLILDKPFLGALVLRLPVEEGDPQWCRTVATDARKFYYNREYISQLRAPEMQFVLAHEALHCGLLHFARRQNRVRQRWDLACDYAINPLLVADGLTAPPDARIMREFEGMTAEEIYPCIDDTQRSTSFDQHIYDSENQMSDGGSGRTKEQEMQHGEGTAENDPEGAGSAQNNQSPSHDIEQAARAQPPPLTEQEIQSLSAQWQQRLAGAAQQAQIAGKLSSEFARLVNLMLQPQLPWRMLLSRFISQSAREDYSYTRPSNRRGDPAVFPSLRSSELNLAVALDTSGSMTDAEISEFVAEVNAIKGYLRARIILLLCDAELEASAVKVFDYWENVEMPAEVSGGGGTDFRPVFDYLSQQDRLPDVLVYFTDGRGYFPDVASSWPTLWLVKGSSAVPFGQRIQLN